MGALEIVFALPVAKRQTFFLLKVTAQGRIHMGDGGVVIEKEDRARFGELIAHRGEIWLMCRCNSFRPLAFEIHIGPVRAGNAPRCHPCATRNAPDVASVFKLLYPRVRLGADLVAGGAACLPPAVAVASLRKVQSLDRLDREVAGVMQTEADLPVAIRERMMVA